MRLPDDGQPDFATILVHYVPIRRSSIEVFQPYLWSFRDEGVFQNTSSTRSVMTGCGTDPHWLKVTGTFNIRGGIGITVESEHTKTAAREQWRTPLRSALDRVSNFRHAASRLSLVHIHHGCLCIFADRFQHYCC
jgi:7-cyano-7-deazaguanine reductase